MPISPEMKYRQWSKKEVSAVNTFLKNKHLLETSEQIPINGKIVLRRNITDFQEGEMQSITKLNGCGHYILKVLFPEDVEVSWVVELETLTGHIIPIADVSYWKDNGT